MNTKKDKLPYLSTSLQGIIIQYCLPPPYANELKEKTSRLFNFLNSWYPTSNYHRDIFNTKSESRPIVDFSYCRRFIIINTEKFWYLEFGSRLEHILGTDCKKLDILNYLKKRNFKRIKMCGFNNPKNKCYMYW